MNSLEQRLQRAELDLALSLECLALEQEGAKRVEHELVEVRHELAGVQAELAAARRQLTRARATAGELRFARRQFSRSQRDLGMALKELEVARVHQSLLHERWQSAEQRQRELEFEQALLGLDRAEAHRRAAELEEQLYLSEERRLEDQEERRRLSQRLLAAQERARELEEMLCERSPGHPVRLDHTLAQLLGNKPIQPAPAPVSVARQEVEGWLATWSPS